MTKPKTRSQKDSNETSSNGAESNEIKSSASALDSSSTLMKRLSDAKAALVEGASKVEITKKFNDAKTALEEGASKAGITKKNAKKVGRGIAWGVIGSRLDSYASTLAAPSQAPLMAAVSATATPEVPLNLNNEGSFIGNFLNNLQTAPASENVSLDAESVQVLELTPDAEQGTGFFASIAQTVSDQFTGTTESQYGVDAVSTEEVAQAPSFIERTFGVDAVSTEEVVQAPSLMERAFGVDAILTEVEQGPGFFENLVQKGSDAYDGTVQFGSDVYDGTVQVGSDVYHGTVQFGSDVYHGAVETCKSGAEWVSETHLAAGFLFVTGTIANGTGNLIQGVGGGFNLVGEGLQALGTLAKEHDILTAAAVTALAYYGLQKCRQHHANKPAVANVANVEDEVKISSSVRPG